MLSKSDPEAIESYLSDASNLAGGRAARVVFPENPREVAEALVSAAAANVPVTVAGAGTGVVGGRVPEGGVVLSTQRLARIVEVARESSCGRAIAEAGVILADLQRAARTEGLFYPPDPTEWSCFLGGTIATNASGARTFKYGPTRPYVRRLQVALTTGDLLNLRRGEFRASLDGRLRIPLAGGRSIEARLPTYRMPATRKHAAGYYVEPRVDAVDLFIGSEGTLGVVTEAEVSLLPLPEGVLSGIVFFASERDLLAFVREARDRSLATRAAADTASRAGVGIDARALEYFDAESLRFLGERFPLVPPGAAGAIFFEQEITGESEDALLEGWMDLLERHKAAADRSWFGTAEADRAEMSAFRHALPVMVNEWLTRHGQRKVSTDMAVPDAAFPLMLSFYQETLRARALQYVIFGHIGDNHVHVNILPRDDAEAAAARGIYLDFIRRAVELGGTISAEHGVGKLKRVYLRELYGEEHLREMADLKRSFDPACVLGRGNIFDEGLLPPLRG